LELASESVEDSDVDLRAVECAVSRVELHSQTSCVSAPGTCLKI
jgi:hypothetical protein